MSRWPNLSCNCSPFGECECTPEVGETVTPPQTQPMTIDQICDELRKRPVHTHQAMGFVSECPACQASEVERVVTPQPHPQRAEKLREIKHLLWTVRDVYAEDGVEWDRKNRAHEELGWTWNGYGEIQDRKGHHLARSVAQGERGQNVAKFIVGASNYIPYLLELLESSPAQGEQVLLHNT